MVTRLAKSRYSATGWRKLRQAPLIWLMVAGLIFLAACRQPAETGQPTPAPLAQLPTDTPSPPPATPTPYATPIPPTPTHTPTVTPSPTPTPIPLLLAAPPAWTEVAERAVAGSERPWQIVVNEDPAALLAQNQVDVALVPDGNGALIWQEPLALAVPFTTEWENSPLTDAQRILAEGHALVTVQPWSELTPRHKALRIDGRSPVDPDYPFQNRLTLDAAPGQETAVSELIPLLQAAIPPDPVVHLATVGDIMLDRSLGAVISRGNLAYPFANVAHLFHAADVTVGNLESALGDVGQPEPKSYPFRAPPEAAQALALAGFDVVSLANNHGMDYGPEALLQGIELLRAAGVAPIGAGANAAAARAPYIMEINGLRLAFLGYVHVPVEARSGFDTRSWEATADAPGLAWAEPELIMEDVTAVRDQVDHVIVVLHSGYEYIEEPSPPQVAAAHAAIDAGATLVIGHHAHILQGIQFRRGGVILYGLGNFAFEIDGPPETAVFNVWLDRNGVREIEIVPTIIQFGGQPRLAEPWEAAPIRRQVYRLTNLLRHD